MTARRVAVTGLGMVSPIGEAAALDPEYAGVAHVTGASRRQVPLRAALTNAFAFGGTNAVLAFRACAAV